jgi:hypothetical protein
MSRVGPTARAAWIDGALGVETTAQRAGAVAASEPETPRVSMSSCLNLFLRNHDALRGPSRMRKEAAGKALGKKLGASCRPQQAQSAAHKKTARGRSLYLRFGSGSDRHRHSGSVLHVPETLPRRSEGLCLAHLLSHRLQLGDVIFRPRTF